MSEDEISRRIAALETNWRDVDWRPSEAAMLRYAELLTRDPQAVTEDLIQDMSAAGWTDRGIHDLCCIVAYFAFVNRVADGLGVELESDGRP